MKAMLAEVLKQIKPSKKEEQQIKELVQQILKKIKIKDAKAVLGGSGAKGTWLRNTYDTDIYVQFNPKKYKDKNISKILYKELKKKFKKVEVLHGSRDYFRIFKEDFTIEIVPILDIKKAEDAANITDVSPLHAEWVKKHNKGDEIRLAKAFCRAQSCYGAESYIQGFSGYVLEILTIKYGSFENLMRAAAKWKAKEYIDVEKHGKKLNKAKTYSPLILIDPVQGDRNAAAALNKKNYQKFIQSAQSFLKHPAKEFFEKKEVTIEELKKKSEGKKLLLLQVKPVKGKEDVIGAKLLKTLEYLKKQLKLNDFKIYDYNWKWDETALFWFIMDAELLPETKEHQGPKLSQTKHVEKFKIKNKNHKIYEKNGRVYAEIPRTYRTPEGLIEELIKDFNVRKRVKEIKLF